MGFVDEIKAWAEKGKILRPQLQTEEAVKHALVMPFLQMLGYNVFDPTEIVPEFISDHGIKKGEKVDYAVMRDGEPHILIEVKGLSCEMTAHSSQLYRYFSVTKAKFAILTNGICYQLFSDLDEPNKMDSKPFLIVDLDNPRDQSIIELEKFHKKNYNVDLILSTANELKYTNQIKEFLGKELKEPSEEFIRFFVKNVYDGKLMPQVVQRFEPLVKRSIAIFLNELVSDKLKYALEGTERSEPIDPPISSEPLDKKTAREIVTTEEELETYVIIRWLLRDLCGQDHQVTHKDTASYFGIMLDNNTRKWICRVFITSRQKVVEFRKGGKKQIQSPQEIESFRDDLVASAKIALGAQDEVVSG